MTANLTPLTDAFMGEYPTEIGWEDFARQLERRVAELEDALRPFAERADYFDRVKMADGKEWPDDHLYADDSPSEIYIGQLRQARAILENKHGS